MCLFVFFLLPVIFLSLLRISAALQKYLPLNLTWKSSATSLFLRSKSLLSEDSCISISLKRCHVMWSFQFKSAFSLTKVISSFSDDKFLIFSNIYLSTLDINHISSSSPWSQLLNFLRSLKPHQFYLGLNATCWNSPSPFFFTNTFFKFYNNQNVKENESNCSSCGGRRN